MGKAKADASQQVPKVVSPDETVNTTEDESSALSTETSSHSDSSGPLMLEVKHESNETAETSGESPGPLLPPAKKKVLYPRYSKSKRAALQFPVTKMRNNLRKFNKKKLRISQTAAVYTAAVVEYVVAEVLELAGNAAKEDRRTRVTPRNISMAIKTDQELNSLLGTSIIPGGGVVPNVHVALLPKKKGRSQE